MSLDELVIRTRISRRSLEALEQDDPAALGSVFYFRSFAKQVASALNLKADTQEWQEALAGIPAAPAPLPIETVEHAYTPRVTPLRARRESGWRTVSPVLSFVVVLIACSGVYALVNRFDFSDFTSLEQTGASFSGLFSPQSSSENDTLPADVEVRQVTANSQSAPSRKPDASGEVILLKIAAVEKTWLSVDTDGKHIYSGLLDAADTKELEGRVTAKIRTGNAGGLTVTFNGKELGTLGERGQVRTVVFTRDQYQILAPNLTSRLHLPAVILARWAR